MMNVFYKLVGAIFGWQKYSGEYWVRFIEPQCERATEKGFSNKEIQTMLQYALDSADFEVQFPAMIFRDLIDIERD